MEGNDDHVIGIGLALVIIGVNSNIAVHDDYLIFPVIIKTITSAVRITVMTVSPHINRLIAAVPVLFYQAVDTTGIGIAGTQGNIPGTGLGHIVF